MLNDDLRSLRDELDRARRAVADLVSEPYDAGKAFELRTKAHQAWLNLEIAIKFGANGWRYG